MDSLHKAISSDGGTQRYKSDIDDFLASLQGLNSSQGNIAADINQAATSNQINEINSHELKSTSTSTSNSNQRVERISEIEILDPEQQQSQEFAESEDEFLLDEIEIDGRQQDEEDFSIDTQGDFVVDGEPKEIFDVDDARSMPAAAGAGISLSNITQLRLQNDSPFSAQMNELRLLSEEESYMFLRQDRSKIPFTEIAVAHVANTYFILNNAGLFSHRVVKNRESAPSFLCEPIEPIAVLEKGETSVFVLVRYRDSTNKVLEAVVPDSELTNLTADNYPRFVIPSAAEKQKVGTAINLIYRLKKQRGDIPMLRCYGRTGWTVSPNASDEEVAQAAYITSADPRFQPDERVSVMHGVAGSEDVWLEVAKRAVEHSQLYGLCLAYASSSFAKGLIFNTNIQANLNIFGAAGRGKTTALSLVASLQGSGDKSSSDTPIVVGGSTDASMERAMAASNHGILAIDEADDRIAKNGKTAASALMNLGNGGGRRRIILGQAKKIEVTQNTIFSTSNVSLVERVSHSEIDKDSALRDRVISLSIDDQEIKNPFSNELRGIEEQLSEHYGHALQSITEMLKAGSAGYKALFANLMAECEAIGLTVRSSQVIAQMKLGAQILADFFASKNDPLSEGAQFAIERAIDILAMREVRRATEEKAAIDVRAQIRSFLASNIRKFVIRATNGARGKACRELPCFLFDNAVDDLSDTGVREAQARRARENNDYAMGNATRWGKIEQTELMEHPSDFTGIVMVVASHADEIMRLTGVDISKFKELAISQGCWVTDKSVVKNIFGDEPTTTRVYCFDLKNVDSDQDWDIPL